MEIAFKNRKDKSGFAKAWVLHRKRAAFTVPNRNYRFSSELSLQNKEKLLVVTSNKKGIHLPPPQENKKEAHPA